MKKIFVLFLVVLVFSCKKKKTTEEEPQPTPTNNPTVPPPGPKYAAEFTAYNSFNSSLNTSIGTAKIYNTNGDLISLDYVKLDGSTMAQVFSNEYRYLSSSKTFTAPISWEISDLFNAFPDTTFMSKTFPALGFQTDITKLYDKTQDFTINIDVSTCDSMLFLLGGVTKRIPGKTGITSITFKPSDNVKRSTFDSTEVEVSVQTYNYDIFTVRGRKWKSMTGASTSSHYKYKN